MIYRIDVREAGGARDGGQDVVGRGVRQQIAEFGIETGPIRTSRIFFVQSDADAATVERAAVNLLADPITETAAVISANPAADCRIEIHLKPGVMDPVAMSTAAALSALGLKVAEVRTGRAFVFERIIAVEQLKTIADRVLANGVIESVHFDAYLPTRFETGRNYQLQLKHVSLRNLDDTQLTKLSREGHLFLSLAEMQAVQEYFRGHNREPTDIELETIAQTWSEHCVHKTLKSAVDATEVDESGKTISTRRYGNLIKETIFSSTMELMRRRAAGPFCLSVFVDNAGVIAFDETDAICFKAETHNHPSAIEPYGGSATGVGGVIRDVLGTGLGAKPVANTDVFCVAFPQSTAGKMTGVGATAAAVKTPDPLPPGVIHPKRVLQQIVAGVRDYGNRMGIPTVNGAVYFDNRYVGNPLVFCGCVGLIPRDKVAKQVNPGDAIVVIGGRTGRDGIHGATFSSAELTDTHADEFSHAVQIGNAITEKKVADVILQARDRGLFSAITDCGAGGLSSAIGEMGEKTGAAVHLEKVPLKYHGLRYDEIWISEAQERMVLSVPPAKVQSLLKLCADEDVEAAVIGTFGTSGQELTLDYAGTEVGRLSSKFMHDGIPMPTRSATVKQTPKRLPIESAKTTVFDLKDRLLKTLAHPNVASKHWIIRQYDHEVQGGSVVKPLVGPMQIGPSDAAVIRPKLSSYRGVAIGCGLQPAVVDPYEMAVAAIDEAVRNVVCVGCDYNQIAILDNFCWPSVDDAVTMGTLVRACEACRDVALAFEIPFISGKDSLHNQFTNGETGEVIRIPATLLISAIGIVPDVRKCVTMDLKRRTARVCLVSVDDSSDLSKLATLHRSMSAAILAGDLAACHDISDGGVLTAAAEMCIASGLGMIIGEELVAGEMAFAEMPGRYLCELRDGVEIQTFQKRFGPGCSAMEFGLVQHLRKLTVTATKQRVQEISIEEMTAAWRGTLDW